MYFFCPKWHLTRCIPDTVSFVVSYQYFFSRSGSGFEFLLPDQDPDSNFFARSGSDYCLVQKSFQYMKLRDWTSYIGFLKSKIFV